MNLDELLKALAAQKPPPTPTDLRAQVWHAIAQRPDEGRGWLAELLALLSNWRIASAALMLALVVGLSAGQMTASMREHQRTARAALYLDVFSPQAPGSPAKLIAYKP
ncbi:MAG: hypothetical protein JSR82_03205 [Verrucomicrobia bacterium]|nr:hypothetical protein [Verrucomicrobiota bacterium]